MNVRKLTSRDSQRFLEIIENSVEPNASLREAAERYKSATIHLPQTSLIKKVRRKTKPSLFKTTKREKPSL